MNTPDFATFERESLARGFDEVLVREWAPDTVITDHTHPFGVEAKVVAGELWLTGDGQTRHLQAGDAFSLARDTPHAERYGAAGAVVWVARRNGG